MSKKNPSDLSNKIDPTFISGVPFGVVYDGYGDPPIDNAFKLVNLPYERFKNLGRVEKYVEQMKYLFWAAGQPQPNISTNTCNTDADIATIEKGVKNTSFRENTLTRSNISTDVTDVIVIESDSDMEISAEETINSDNSGNGWVVDVTGENDNRNKMPQL
ncbi:7373_t:CDS:1 [Cetraspora pellucida]|uniref:7373_t:CDS:1 n=1 Tax=Cetraspora pellucida TaxID=1433469 RepID=A0A9N9J844_9GLOM|nr:7373_t:CDS:1 [Cetraspora pellucida]